MLIKNIYEKYKHDVYTYLISLTHDPTLAEDLVSDTFLGAIKSLPNFKGNSDIKTWLFSIARYKWYEYLRHEKKHLSFNDLTENYFLCDQDVEDKFIQNDLSSKIIDLLDKEYVNIKNIVYMRIEGYSFYEIAKKYNISENSARVIDFRAKKKIREMLQKEGYNNYE